MSRECKRCAFRALIAFVWVLQSGCSWPTSTQGNQPSAESFAQILSSIGIEMGKPFVAPKGSKVKKRQAPLSNIFQDYSSVEFKNGWLYLDKYGSVRVINLQSPELAAYGDEQLSSIERIMVEGKDIFELSTSDVIRQFGRPSYIRKPGFLNRRDLPTYSYYCYTKKGDVIVVTCTFSRRADGNIKLFDFSVSYVEKADRRAYFLKPGRFILYEWPGSSESDSQQPTTNN